VCGVARGCSVGNVPSVSYHPPDVLNFNVFFPFSFLSSPQVHPKTDYALSTTGARYQRTNTLPSGLHIHSLLPPLAPLRLSDTNDQALPQRGSCTPSLTIQFSVTYILLTIFSFFLHFFHTLGAALTRTSSCTGHRIQFEVRSPLVSRLLCDSH
jgi:hypothetical protein